MDEKIQVSKRLGTRTCESFHLGWLGAMCAGSSIRCEEIDPVARLVAILR
jgi:hypothetical protein